MQNTPANRSAFLLIFPLLMSQLFTDSLCNEAHSLFFNYILLNPTHLNTTEDKGRTMRRS